MFEPNSIKGYAQKVPEYGYKGDDRDTKNKLSRFAWNEADYVMQIMCKDLLKPNKIWATERVVIL